ncbi:MAG: hypothetical protein GY927_16850 [bacterium]|nr:hypothetical protein [bacterium]
MKRIGGFNIITRNWTSKYSRVEQWMIYTHECDHLRRGKSERKADCWASKTGHRQG